MKIIIVGSGDLGYELASQLITREDDVILIENNPVAAKSAEDKLDCKVVRGAGNNMETLKAAGADGADWFICVTGSDEINLISCGLAARNFKIERSIARVKNIDYFTARVTEKSFMGIDYVINPRTEIANSILTAVESGAGSNIGLFESGDLQIRNMVVPRDSELKDLTVSQVMEKIKSNCLIPVIEKDEGFVIPSGDTLIEEDDNVYFLAGREDQKNILKIIGRPKVEVKSVVIFGGSTTAEYILHRFTGVTGGQGWPAKLINYIPGFKLETAGISSIKLIESDYERSKELAEKFPEVIVISADITDESVFTEEGLDKCDLAIAVTDNYELNILSALYAKRIGIDRAISLVHRKNYIPMAYKLGIDSVVSPQESVINPILRFIRKGKFRNLFSIAGSDMGIVEVALGKKSSLAGSKISELSLPEHSLILSISRGGSDFIPHGDTLLETKDRIIIIARQEDVPEIEDMAN